MAVVDLQSYKISVGSHDYPTQHDDMVDAVEAAINAAETWDNASLLAQTLSEALMTSAAAEGAKFGAKTSERKAATSAAEAADAAEVVTSILSITYWLGTV